MRRARFPKAIAAAVLAHAAAALVLHFAPPRRSLRLALASQTISEQPVSGELLVETDDELRPAPAAALPDTATAPPEPRSAETRAPRATPVVVVAASAPNVALPDVRDAPPKPADSGNPFSITRPATIDLGIGTYWKNVATSGAPQPIAPADRAGAPQSPTSAILRDELDAHDRALGLSAGSTLAAVAREAASATIAPDVGSATFDVECDGAGKVVTARVVGATGDMAAWNAVARELVRLMSAKAVRVPAGARGVRARVRVTAARTPPSGTKGTVSPGAVPDDVPGSDPVCVGTGAQRRCTAGMVVGVTANTVDVVNVGAKASRIVRAVLVSESRL